MWRRVWNGTSKENLQKSELKILAAAGITEFKIEDIYYNEKEYLHTVIVGQGPTLVLIPGFGATVLFWFKMLKELSRHYTVYGVDLIGMGASARPSVNFKEREDWEDFFLDSLEAWRQELKLESFYLVGHSFGGYMATEYTVRFPHRVKSLVLVSPLGTTKAPTGFSMKEKITAMKCPKRCIFKTVSCCWERGVTPFALIRGFGRLGKYPLRVWSRNMLVSVTKEECQMMEDYCFQYLTMPGCGEHAMAMIMSPPSWAYHPIDQKIAECVHWSTPVHFIYGEVDWMKMNSFGAQKMLDDGLVKGSIEFIPKATHHPYLGNPEGTLEAILRALQQQLLRRSNQLLQLRTQFRQVSPQHQVAFLS